MEFTVCLQVVKLAITTLATQPRRVYPAVLTRQCNADVTSQNHAQVAELRQIEKLESFISRNTPKQSACLPRTHHSKDHKRSA